VAELTRGAEINDTIVWPTPLLAAAVAYWHASARTTMSRAETGIHAGNGRCWFLTLTQWRAVDWPAGNDRCGFVTPTQRLALVRHRSSVGLRVLLPYLHVGLRA
jgi:hypothetical protein